MMIKTRLLIYYIALPIGWILLSLGAGVGIDGLAQTIQLYGREYFFHTYCRGLPSLVTLILSFAYFVIWLKKGFSLRTMLMYLGSYLLLGPILYFLIQMIGKGFAPSPPDEARRDIIISYLIIAAASAIAILGIIWAARRGHIWHNKWFTPKNTTAKSR